MSKEFEVLERRARGLDAETLAADLQGIATDPRFAAVLAWLMEREERFVAAVSKPECSREHGPMAHAAGGAYAARSLINDLKERLEAKPRRRQGPEGE